MLETVITIILAPVAVCAVGLTGLLIVAFGKGIHDTFKKNK